ncbi:MAG TPA: Ig-like domain-containing protein [Bacteroidales bacterium]|nr:Ig-like domain-containing protein [Bacteroidales bacterium]
MGHIGPAGRMRLAKAQWWLLARIAGWDGGNNPVPVTSISVTGEGGLNTISTDKGTLQLIAAIAPANATNKTVTWSIQNGTGQATINASGVVSAVNNGTVTARATANDGSGVYGTLNITITNQVTLVTGITVTGAGGATTISTDNGTLQLSANVIPANATNKTVTWSIQNVTGHATISASGLVTAVNNGTVTARAIANDGSGIYGTLNITISNQVTLVTGITVTGTGGATTISTDNGTLQLSAAVTPDDATNKTVTWSIQNGTGQATINVSGLVTAVSNGTVTARATANDGSGIYGSLTITISNQVKLVTGITITGAGGATGILTDNGTLQLSANVTPADATDNTVTWSIQNGTGEATINAEGLVTAVNNGTVTARATANDGSGVNGTLVITITNQVIPVTGITVSGAGGATTISTDNGTLQLSANVTPADATNKTVTWSLQNVTGQGTISATGIVTAVRNGTVAARATANDGSGVYGTLIITISNQIIPVTGITVTGAGGASTISTDDGTLQLSASVTPADGTNKTVTWSIQNGTGQATINASGLVSAVNNGTVTARATANDGSGVYGTLTISISNQVIPVTGINVTGSGGATTISADDGTLQLYETVTPADATNKNVTWSIQNGSGQAIINSSGLVTAVNNGTVTARANANDGSGVFGTLIITISNQVIPVTGITVTGAGGNTTISIDNGTLQLSAAVSPFDATDQTVIWSIQNGTGQATINSSGIVTAVKNGTVTARATANDGSGVFGTFTITISNQVIPVTGINVTGAGGATTISLDNGTLQLNADVSPSDASNKTVTWSVENGTGQATIDASGLVTAISVGTVIARADANDGSGVYGTLTITILVQVIPVTGIIVTGEDGATTISTDNGQLQLSAIVGPNDATDKTVTWSIQNGTGLASISASGMVSAISDGTVTARATANDGSGIYGSLAITISNQIVSVSTISVTGAGGASIITSDNGMLQLTATISPDNASDKSVTWSIQNVTGQASISPSGLVTAISNGNVTARATANDGSGIYGTLNIVISNQIIPVTGIDVTGSGGSTTISTDNGTLLLNAEISPSDATNKSVSWSVENGTGQASVSTSGLLTAISNGTVTARATANDGSGVFGTLLITISNQVVSVSSISVTGAGGASIITSDNGTLQLTATVLPENATNKTITWSVQNGTGQATINASGLVSAVNNGTVTARATANDGSGIYGTLTITISNQVIPVSGITVTGAEGATTISTDNGSLQLSANVTPANATNATVTWSIQNGTGQAAISTSGLVTAVSNGTVTARATANDGSGMYGTLTLTISNQVIPVTGITVTGSGGATTISTDDGTLLLTSAVVPTDASNKTVTWSIQNGTGQATISTSGLVTAIKNGIVTARATARDGSGVYGTLTITISNQIIPVTGITLAGAGGATSISADNGTLQLSASVIPSDATNKTVTWSIRNNTGKATISASGLVTAVSNGTVTATATSNDGSDISGSMTISITDQIIFVSSVTVQSENNVSEISSANGTLPLSAYLLPGDATDKSVTWSILNGTGVASISAAGIVTAIADGNVTAVATANDGSGVKGTFEISISNQIIPVDSIMISCVGGLHEIKTKNGSVQLNAIVMPLNATDRTVTWSVQNSSGIVLLSSDGLVTAMSNGTAIIKALANDGSGKFSTITLTITGQNVAVSSIIVYSPNLITNIDSINGELQLLTNIYPANASKKEVTWAVEKVSGSAEIDQNGLLTALDYGMVRVRATATDGSGTYGILNIQINSPTIVSDPDETRIKIIYSSAFLRVLFHDRKMDQVRICSIDGKILKQFGPVYETLEIDRSLLPAGVYLLILSEKKSSRVIKFISQ